MKWRHAAAFIVLQVFGLVGLYFEASDMVKILAMIALIVAGILGMAAFGAALDDEEKPCSK